MKKIALVITIGMLLSTISLPLLPAQTIYGEDQTKVEVLSNDLLRAFEPRDPQLLELSGPGPGYYDTSEYMIGSVVVGVILLESNGSIDPNTENWTPTEESNVQNEINQALTWWAGQNTFAGISFTLDVHLAVPTSYEPIIHPSAITNDAWEKLWVCEAMAGLGYSSGDWMKRTRDYINAIRTAYNTDWAYAVYIVDSSADVDGCFSDGFCAYAYLGGPFAVMTYDNNGWGINAMNQVFAHETGHIFWATDEYNGVTEYSGYLNAADVEGSGCLMDTNALSLSSGTKLQIGWRDTDGDTIQDIIDTDPETYLTPYTPDPTSNTVLTYNGSATEVPYPNQNPQPHNPGNDVTINFITLALYRIDGSYYMPATPKDGLYDEPVEDYTFTTFPLPPRPPHTIEAISMNSVGNVDKTPAKDTVTIDNPPTNPTITGPTNGKAGKSYTYNVSAGDPDADQVYYWVDWGDSTNTGWLGPFPPGTITTATHTWQTKKDYTIMVKAKDSYTMESGWTTLQVSMPKNMITNNGVFIQWLNQHPHIANFIHVLAEKIFELKN